MAFNSFGTRRAIGARCPTSLNDKMIVHANKNLFCPILRGAFACILLLVNLKENNYTIGKIL